MCNVTQKRSGHNADGSESSREPSPAPVHEPSPLDVTCAPEDEDEEDEDAAGEAPLEPEPEAPPEVETLTPAELQAIQVERQKSLDEVVWQDGPIEGVIAAVCALLRMWVEQDIAALTPTGADADLTDDITAVACAASLRAECERQCAALAQAVVVPWPRCSKPSKALIPKWQRLRVLESLGRLGRCWVGKATRCDATTKKHQGCKDRRNLTDKSCQRGSLLILSQTIGGLDYYADFRPLLNAYGELVPPPEWPSGKSNTARAMVGAVWDTWRRRRKWKCHYDQRGRSPKATGPNTESASGVTGGASTIERSERGRPGAADTKRVWGSAPLDLSDTSKCARSATVTARLSPALVARADELGDHALYVCYALTRSQPKPKRQRERDEQREGWCALNIAALDRDLGMCRRGGKRVHRLADVLGSRETPGLLEREGIIERLADYSAGGRKAYSQRFRLTAPYRCHEDAREEITLSLRARAATMPATHVLAGPAVHPWLASSYPGLALDTDTALRRLCAFMGCPETTDTAVVRAHIDGMAGPTLLLTKRGEPRKRGQPEDPRVKLSETLTHIEEWTTPDAARGHVLRRDAKVGRLVSPLAGLPHEAHSLITLDGRPVVTLDVRACGLALRAAELRASGADKDPDVARWCAMIEDPTEDPYTHVYALMHGRAPTPTERATFKGSVLKDLYYSTPDLQRKSPLAQAVATVYPGFTQHLLSLKYADGDSGGELARGTLRMETAIMLEALPTALEAAGIRCATKHDALLVRDVDAEAATAIFGRVLQQAGVRAVVRRD